MSAFLMSPELPDYFAKHPCLPQHNKTRRPEGKKSVPARKSLFLPFLSQSDQTLTHLRLYLFWCSEDVEIGTGDVLR